MPEAFMFCKILSSDLELCKDILELILDIKIEKVELSQTQKEIDIKYDSEVVRLDVYVEDGKNTVYDIEMQKVDTILTFENTCNQYADIKLNDETYKVFVNAESYPRRSEICLII
ncbi:MAG: hypothetical protein K6F93_07830 [Lachnospiraceae bacterium]|nr:hypothetical protein [Lachnospiraceae bacterium]